MAAIVGDVIQNLRSALDQLAYQLVLIGTGATPGNHVYFPIGEDIKSFNDKKKSQLRGATAGAIQAVESLRPYKGGSDVLWQIHKLNIVDKHRALLTVGSAFSSFDVGALMHRQMEQLISSNPSLGQTSIPKIDFFLHPADRQFPLRPGGEFFIDAPDAEPDSTMRFKFDVAFGEMGIIEGEPIIETLKRMARRSVDVYFQATSGVGRHQFPATSLS